MEKIEAAVYAFEDGNEPYDVLQGIFSQLGLGFEMIEHGGEDFIFAVAQTQEEAEAKAREWEQENNGNEEVADEVDESKAPSNAANVISEVLGPLPASVRRYPKWQPDPKGPEMDKAYAHINRDIHAKKLVKPKAPQDKSLALPKVSDDSKVESLATKLIDKMITEGRHRPGAWVVQPMGRVNLTTGKFRYGSAEDLNNYFNGATLLKDSENFYYLISGSTYNVAPGTRVLVDIDVNANYRPINYRPINKSWESREKAIVVKVWPTGTDTLEILKEVKEITGSNGISLYHFD